MLPGEIDFPKANSTRGASEKEKTYLIYSSTSKAMSTFLSCIIEYTLWARALNRLGSEDFCQKLSYKKQQISFNISLFYGPNLETVQKYIQYVQYIVLCSICLGIDVLECGTKQTVWESG